MCLSVVFSFLKGKWEDQARYRAAACADHMVCVIKIYSQYAWRDMCFMKALYVFCMDSVAMKVVGCSYVGE